MRYNATRNGQLFWHIGHLTLGSWGCNTKCTNESGLPSKTRFFEAVASTLSVVIRKPTGNIR